MKFKKLFQPKPPSKDFLYCRDIIRKYLEDPKIEKLISPESCKYFLLNKEESINIMVSLDKITISQNHSFLYTQSFELRLLEQLITEIKHSIEKDRQELEKRLFYKQIDLLRQIFNK